MSNINDVYFDGYYKEIWRSLIPEGLTKAEVEFLIQESSLKAGDRVLDLMCGYGRHALALARKQIEVEAVDNLNDYVAEIKVIATNEGLPVTAVQQNALVYQPRGIYKLAICMGNSLSFFSAGETRTLFSMISSCLDQGDKFIFNSWTIAETVIRDFREKTWTYVGDIKFLADSKYLFSPARIETESTFIPTAGSTEVKKAVDYIYSLNEIEGMLNGAGLGILDKWSIPGKKKFTLGEPRIYIVSKKL